MMPKRPVAEDPAAPNTPGPVTNRAGSEPPSTLSDVCGLMEAISAFARIGSTTPDDAEMPLRFDGFEHFVPEPGGKSILEAWRAPDGALVVRPGTPGHYPEPSGVKTVVVGVGREHVTYTAARHWIDGPNRFGQNSAHFPYCLVNLAAWRRTPCDLRSARWYRTEEEAVNACAPPPESTGPELSACTAMFSGGLQVELRREGGNRWLMWEIRYGRRTKKEFASPYLRHAKATAEHWYGVPLNGWQTPGGDER